MLKLIIKNTILEIFKDINFLHIIVSNLQSNSTYIYQSIQFCYKQAKPTTIKISSNKTSINNTGIIIIFIDSF